MEAARHQRKAFGIVFFLFSLHLSFSSLSIGLGVTRMKTYFPASPGSGLKGVGIRDRMEAICVAVIVVERIFYFQHTFK